MKVAEELRTETRHIRKLLRHSMDQCQAVNLETLIRCVDVSPDAVRRELAEMIAGGEVEVLRPVDAEEDGSTRREHYRLVRPTDRDYVWEQDVVVRVPTGRFVDYTHLAEGTLGSDYGLGADDSLRSCFRSVARRNEMCAGVITAGRKNRMRTWIKAAAIGLTVALTAVATLTAADQNKIVVDGSTTVGPIAKAFAEYYMMKNADVKITVSESGSGNGAKSLMNGACDIATMSRPMKSSEKAGAKDAGVLVIEHIVAMDGIALIVHPSNPVQGLEVKQIRDIYTGKITNWKELGGPDKPIVVISRETNSGTYETFETLVMDKQKMVDKVEYVGSNGAIRQRVMTTENAIGYVGLAFLEGVKAVKVNKIEVSAETVKSKEYPLSRPLYMYTNGRPKDGTHLANFVGLSKTPEGIKMINDIGFVAIDK